MLNEWFQGFFGFWNKVTWSSLDFLWKCFTTKKQLFLNEKQSQVVYQDHFDYLKKNFKMKKKNERVKQNFFINGWFDLENFQSQFSLEKYWVSKWSNSLSLSLSHIYHLKRLDAVI